ncbi:hypothetical protein ACFV0O_18130 [Kitasatospora sp. NPDC059577]
MGRPGTGLVVDGVDGGEGGGAVDRHSEDSVLAHGPRTADPS